MLMNTIRRLINNQTTVATWWIIVLLVWALSASWPAPAFWIGAVGMALWLCGRGLARRAIKAHKAGGA